MTTDFFNKINTSLVGFDDIFNDIFKSTKTNYPPYNLYKTKDSEYFIQVALAGWNADNIEVSEEGNTLTIRSNEYQPETKEEIKYLCKGISDRNFKLSFTLSKMTKVIDVSMKDGMLVVHLKEEKPQIEIKSKVYPISKS